MKAVEFCYWLQGMFEIGEPISLDEKQTEIIKKHLNLVFYHEIDKNYPHNEQAVLNNIHSGTALEMTNLLHQNVKIPQKPNYNNHMEDDVPNTIRC